MFAHFPHHVEGLRGLAPQRRLEHVLLDPRLKGRLQVVVDLKVSVRRTEPPDTLVRAPVIVVLDPEGDALARLLKVLEAGPLQKLLQDALPEAFDLPQGHRMVRLASQMVDLVLIELPLELGPATPGRVLAPVVR